MTPTDSNRLAPIATQSVFSRPAALVAGVIGLLALTAIATTMATRALAPGEGQARKDASAPLGVEAAAPTQASPAEKATAVAPHGAGKSAHAVSGSVTAAAPGQRTAGVCATCGKVESVSAVSQKGEATGLGVVGGAVVGGLVGSRIGGGSGKSLATVLGAVGGGVAGNEVEKRSRATTVYQVHVRMNDGSLRTFTQSTAPAVGQPVTVEGTTLRERPPAS